MAKRKLLGRALDAFRESKATKKIDELSNFLFTDEGIPGLGRTLRFASGAGKGQTPSLSDKLFFGVPAAGFAAETLVPSVGGFARDLVFRPGVTDQQRSNNLEQLYRIKREKKLRKDYFDLQLKMQEAVRQLATLSPQKYQELLAGKKLPADAIVFGGSPRVDLLQQFATDSAMQSLTPQGMQPNNDPLEALGL